MADSKGPKSETFSVSIYRVEDQDAAQDVLNIKLGGDRSYVPNHCW